MRKIEDLNAELRYVLILVRERGDDNVTRDPKTIAAYLRTQAAAAYRLGAFRASAALGYAATAINEDARNNHPPSWDRALAAIVGAINEGEASV